MPKSDSRDKLILSAQQLIWERGVVGVSLRDVREHAGLGHGSMYHHFKCKNELVLEAIARSSQEVLGSIEKIASAEISAYEKIEMMLVRKKNIQKGCRIGNLTNDSVVMSEDELRNCVKGMFSEFTSLVKGIFIQGVKDGEFSSKLDADEASWGLISLMEGGFICARALGSNAPYKSAVAAYLKLLRGG